MDRFAEKDRLLRHFDQSGAFPGTAVDAPALPSAKDVALWWIMLFSTLCMLLMLLPTVVCKMITGSVLSCIALALVLQFALRDV
jgi:hypothetical protein